MVWTDSARIDHTRKTARYPSDMLDSEWALIAPLLPAAKPGGRPRSTDLREVMNAVLYIGSRYAQILVTADQAALRRWMTPSRNAMSSINSGMRFRPSSFRHLAWADIISLNAMARPVLRLRHPLVLRVR